MRTTKRITRHGVFMNIFGLGTLLTGKSGSGKSELALGLVDRGHQLIADDITEFFKQNEQTLIGQCPTLLQDLLEVRGLGILNMRKLFGHQAMQQQAALNFIIQLQTIEQLTPSLSLDGHYDEENILGIFIPTLTLPLNSGRNLALLIECAVRNQLLKQQGNNAMQELAQRQYHQLQKQESLS